ncbi:MAG: hypothetical protein ACRD50_01725 [Candidatus Acidiferrales bacterium]
MNSLRCIGKVVLALSAMLLWGGVPSAAQDSQQSQSESQTTHQQQDQKQAQNQDQADNQEVPQGVNSGNYNIQQTVDFGGRFTNITGNQDIYGTYVNLGSGVRLYEHTLSMRSLNHNGLLFDNLYLSSFGYGGDPNDMTRLRVYKNKWYDFGATFRRDKNFWDYNLLGNPLNPTNSNPAVIITNSVHLMDTVRRMGDYRLTILPQSRVRIRFGYYNNVSEGPSLSTIHEGTDATIFQNVKTTVNGFQFGVDFKVLPRTNFSYDQFLSYYKGDTSYDDVNLSSFALANGTGVDLGSVFNTPANQPCKTPLSNASTVPPTVNPVCNGFLAYSRVGRPRTSLPTEQLSFQSNYFKSVEIAGRLNYSATDSNVNDFLENFVGNNSHGSTLASTAAGPASSRRVVMTADAAITWKVTEKFRVSDTLRFNYFRIPGLWSFLLSNLFQQAPLTGGSSVLGGKPGTFPTGCPAPFIANTCPQHSSSSLADISQGADINFLGQDAKYNTFQLEYDFTRRFGGRLGYRYADRSISDFAATTFQTPLFAGEVFFPGPGQKSAFRGDCALVNNALPPGCTQNADGTVVFSGMKVTPCLTGLTPLANQRCNTPIHENSALLGLWSRPTNNLRMSFDLELFYADNTFTRISPRELQHYKFRLSYKPLPWWSLGGSFNILENRDNVATVFNRQHNRAYDFSTNLQPSDRFGFDMGYEYSDYFSTTNICFAISPVPIGSALCTITGSPAPIQGTSIYTNLESYGYFDFNVKPIKRLTTMLGYNILSTSGNTLILNPNAPTGPLAFNYNRPTAAIEYELSKNVTYRTTWGFYDYHEKSQPDPTGPRNFRGNLFNFSLRYVF